MRIQKYLSEQGVASRRTVESWLAAGYITLNGVVVTEPGTHFDPEKDELIVDAKALAEKKYYFLFNKPKGIITVGAQVGETEIKDIIEMPKGVVPVGRLDKDSGGLIMLTNDGVVARRIMEPQFAHEKKYDVSFYNSLTDAAIQQLNDGVYLFGEKTKPIEVERLSGFRAILTLREGKNRQIRRLCAALGAPVKMLVRIQLLCFPLNNLLPGKARELSPVEIIQLYEELGLHDRL